MLRTFLQVNSALILDNTRKQWVDLGIHTEACMTRPETCGAAGRALSMWVNVIACSSNDGIISSLGPAGLWIFCSIDEIR